MKKDYGWVDYTNLGLNVIQTAQLEAVRSQLACLQQLELDERAKAKVIENLRQWVFEIEGALNDLLKVADQVDKANPDEAKRGWRAVYMNCYVLKDCFEKTGVNPATFPEFNDKDRVRKVMSEIEDAINRFYERMDVPSREEVDECRRFIKEDPELQELIGWMQALKEKLGLDPNAAQAEFSGNEAEIFEIEKGGKSVGNASINVTRKTELAYMARSMHILVDSQEVGKVADNKTLNFSVQPGKHIFQAQIGNNITQPFEIALNSGKELRLECGVTPKRTWGMITGVDIFLKSVDPWVARVNHLKERNDILRTPVEEIKKLLTKFGKLSEAQVVALQKDRQIRIEKACSASKTQI